MKIRELRTINKDITFIFFGKTRRTLRAGNNARDEEQVPGLEMTLDTRTGIIAIDAPGDSTFAHVSWAIPYPAEATIPKKGAPVVDAPPDDAPPGTESMELADVTAYRVGDRFKHGDSWAEVVAIDKRHSIMHYEIVGSVERTRRRGAAAPPAKRLTKAELDAAQGFDSTGDDIEDAEVARLMQSPSAKKAVKARYGKKGAKKAPVVVKKIEDPTKKPAPSTIEDEDDEEIVDDDE